MQQVRMMIPWKPLALWPCKDPPITGTIQPLVRYARGVPSAALRVKSSFSLFVQRRCWVSRFHIVGSSKTARCGPGPLVLAESIGSQN